MQANNENNEHLTEEQLAQYAEAYILDSLDALPIDIRKHIHECDQCSVEALHLIDILKKEEIAEVENSSHPENSRKKYLMYFIIAGVILILAFMAYFLLTKQWF